VLSTTQGQGRLIVLVGPSGSGKTTLARSLIAAMPSKRRFSVSHTTRPRRDQERDGVDYHFIDRESFAALRDQGAFVEHAEVHGNLYGTSRRAIEEPLANGQHVLFDVDIQGAGELHAAFGDRAHLIFVIPPGWDELVGRLVGRSSESEATLQRRLRTARVELQRVVDAIGDGVPWTCLINDDLDRALFTLEKMVAKPPQTVRLKDKELLIAMVDDAAADPLAVRA
jgi:guanylate kinase